ncbi:MAG TPA: DNA polymerase III subunit gamma/tau [Spirochaetota bacterium]|nr:DNA polymerase III subunit gamma/tau [Spirochaetota bacterium]
MAYQVIARKWRPQNFDEVLHQDHVSTTIRNSIKNGRISHAYIFSGPRGVGKTTMARILGKSLNCLAGLTGNPCGVCENCVEIRDGVSFDVIEIDGASNRGIENIRELRENVNFAPVKSRYKIYIIDEVHMLTKEAFNALLKTLEEPPPHAVFVFATTEIHQVPDTILSRCQKFFFKKISIEAIVNHLGTIVEAEGFSIDRRALYPIARAADGSMRDAQSLLDQIISFSEGNISEGSALAVLGVVPVESYLALLRNVLDTDAAAAIHEIDRISSLGVDLSRYVAGLVDIIRTVRLVQHGIAVQEILGFSPEETGEMKTLADAIHDEELSVFFRILTDLQGEIRYSVNERINIEMAVLDMIAAKKRPSVAAIIAGLEGKVTAATQRKDERKESAPVPKPKPEEPDVVKKNDPPRAAPAQLKPRAPEPEKKKIPVPDPAPADPVKQWGDILAELKTRKPLLFVKLENTVIAKNTAGFHLTFPRVPGETSGERMLDRNDLSYIKAEFRRATGSELLTDIPGKTPADLPSGTVRQVETPPSDAEMISDTVEEDLAQNDPLVETIVELFHGKIINDTGEK